MTSQLGRPVEARALALFGVLDDAHGLGRHDGAAGPCDRAGRPAGRVGHARAVMHALSSVQAIHLQCYGEHDPAEPLRSCLRLPGGVRLAAADIFGLRRVTTRLVVLGACEGAMSRARSGDEPLRLIPAL